MPLYETDFVIIKNNKPVESYDVIYHYSSVIEMINTGFELNEGEEFIAMTELPVKLQKEYYHSEPWLKHDVTVSKVDKEALHRNINKKNARRISDIIHHALNDMGFFNEIIFDGHCGFSWDLNVTVEQRSNEN
jgi:hypothetical protein